MVSSLTSHSLTQSEAMTTPPQKRHYKSLLHNIHFSGLPFASFLNINTETQYQ
jgi:hypothetical protein